MSSVGPLYPKSQEPHATEALFLSPTSEYRGAPFWSWNCRLNRAQLLRQIAILQQMGFGGFQMHARTGLATPYLGREFMTMARACIREAKRLKLLAWLYDEDRWPSGYAGGLVTVDPQHRAKYLLFTRTAYGGVRRPTPNVSFARAGRTENGVLLARYEVSLGYDGSLSSYRRLLAAEPADEGAEWLAYLESTDSTPWFNHQTYVDTLSSAALARFVEVTYDAFHAEFGSYFGTVVPAIFTDEPQHIFRESFTAPDATEDRVLPFTGDFDRSYAQAYGQRFLDTLPECFWELPNGDRSVARYRYHNHVTDRFAAAFAGTLGTWCEQHGVRLTGHMMEEPTLGSQTKAVGEAMRSLAHFHLPGVDMLCDRTELNTLKQAQSVAHQYGRPGVMSELYGVTGWHYDFIGHKAQGDWQAALGVTLRVPHLAWVSMAGEAKRDYPASISYQSPWWREYPLIENHFARINVLMTRGRPVVRVAVIHPIESYWLSCGPLSQTAAERGQLEKQFAELPALLLAGQIDFDYISEALLPAQLSTIATAPLAVGVMAYDAVLIPNLRTIRSTTMDALEQFAAAGGNLIFAGSTPALVDGAKSTRPSLLAETTTWCHWGAESILRELQELRELDAVDGSGDRWPSLLYQLRADGGERHLFICNRDRQQGCADLRLRLRGNWRVTEWDTQSGFTSDIRTEHVGGATLIRHSLAAHGHLLLTLRPQENPVGRLKQRKTPAVKTRIWRDAGMLDGPVAVTLSEPNVLLLDQPAWRWNDGPWQPREEMLRLNNVLRARNGLAPATGNDAQPWTDLEPAPSLGTVSLRFSFRSEIPVAAPQLALEDASAWRISFNGHKLSSAIRGWWTDEAIQRVRLPPVDTGENILVLERDYTRRTELEWCYLLGDFGVTVRQRSCRLVSPVRALKCGDWTNQGLPFYGGNVTYCFRTAGRADNPNRWAVRFSSFKGTLLRVRLGRASSRPVAFAPFRLQFGRKPKAGELLKVTVFGHRGNAFGPLHNIDPSLERFGPQAWRSTGEHWSYEYRFQPLGLLDRPRLEKLSST